MATNRRISFLLTANAKNLTKGLNKAQKKLNKFAYKAKSVGRNLTTSLSLPLAAVGGKAVKSAAKFEQLEQSLSILNGSAEKGAEIFKKLQKFSAKTPFRLKNLAKTQKRLQGFGLSADGAFNAVQNLGDLVAATGADFTRLAVAFGQAKAQGKVLTRDLRQLSNAGVPIRKLLAKSLGVTINKVSELVTEGKIGFDELRDAIQKTTSKGGRYFKATEKQANTLTGIFSTFADRVNIALGKIGKSISENLNLKERVKSLGKYLNTLSDKFDSLSKTAQKFIVYGGVITTALGPVIYLTGTLASSISSLIGLFSTISGAVASFTGALGEGGLVAALSSISAPIIAVGAAVAGLAAIIYTNWDAITKYFTSGKGAHFVDVIMEGFNTVKQLASTIFTTVKTEIISIWNSIYNFFARGQGYQTFLAVKESAESAFRLVVDIVKWAVGKIQSFWNTYGKAIISASNYIWNNIKNAVSTVFNEIFNIIEAGFKAISGLIKVARGLITGNWKLVWQGVKKIMFSAVNLILDTIANFLQSFIDTFAYLTDALGLDSLTNTLKGFGNSTSNFVKGLKTVKDEAKQTKKQLSEVNKELKENNKIQEKSNSKSKSKQNLPDRSGIKRKEVPTVSVSGDDSISNGVDNGKIEGVKKKLSYLEKAKNRLVNKVSPAIQKGLKKIGTSFLTMSIKAAATGKSFGNVFKSLLTSLADLAIRVGKIAIATGIAIEGIKKALQSLNPVAAIAAGAALIAVGAAAKSALSNAGKGTSNGSAPNRGAGGGLSNGGSSFNTDVKGTPTINIGAFSDIATASMQKAFERALGKSSLKASGDDLKLATNNNDYLQR